MFATVLMAPFFAMSCPTKPSALIFVGGALFFVGQEIYNWSTYKSASDRTMEIYDKTEDADKQVESLQTAGEQTLIAANKAALKGNFAMSIAITWGVASAVAFIEGAIGAVMAAMGKVDEIGPCKGTPPVVFNNIENKKYFISDNFIGPRIIQQSPSLKKILQTINKGRNDLESYILLKEQNSFYRGGIKSMSLTEYEDIKKADLLSFKETNHITKITKTFSSIIDSVIPSAVAQEEETKEENIDTKDPQNKKAMASGISFGLQEQRWQLFLQKPLQ
jgi:hypothetical protein